MTDEAGNRVTLAALRSDPKNARRHNPRNVGMIAKSMRDVGAARSIVVDEDGVVLAGNATIEAAAEVGIERVLLVDVDGEELVAVRRRGLSDEQRVRLAIADNRAAELAEWDGDVLEALAADVDLSSYWTAAEFDKATAVSADADGESPEIPFTAELMEESNYVVFVFDNAFDWSVVVERFGIGTVKALDSRDGYERMGTGRVLDGKALLAMIGGDDA